MDFGEIVLAVSALLPAAVLCFYVYRKDRVEKEPAGFLILLLALGALTSVPVLLVSPYINGIIDAVFSLFGTEVDGEIFLGSGMYNVYLFISNTVGVGCIEEGFKWLVLFFVTRNSKHFNSFFDGLIYSVFVSLGFAGLENILYSFNYGFSTAVARAFTAVPGHMFFGVIMGTFYSMWNVKNEAAKLENAFKRKGVMKVTSLISGKPELILSYVLPVLAHGFYDYLCSKQTVLSTIIFYVFLIILYITQFVRISKMSKQDADEIGYAISLVCKKYPAVKALVDAAANQVSQTPEKPAPVTPSGVRRTHSFNDFEFVSPKTEEAPEFTPSSQKRPFKVYIDDSDFTG